MCQIKNWIDINKCELVFLQCQNAYILLLLLTEQLHYRLSHFTFLKFFNCFFYLFFLFFGILMRISVFSQMQSLRKFVFSFLKFQIKCDRFTNMSSFYWQKVHQKHFSRTQFLKFCQYPWADLCVHVSVHELTIPLKSRNSYHASSIRNDLPLEILANIWQVMTGTAVWIVDRR